MQRTKSRLRLVKFIGALVLIFGLPLLAIGKIALVAAYDHAMVQNSNGKQSQNTSALPTGSDWPMYLHDPQRTSTTNETLLSPANAASLTKLWSFKTQGAIAASAIVVAGTVYVGSWDGYEYALDENTGVLRWKQFLGQTVADKCYPTTTGITSSATVQNNVVYVGGGDSYWYALDAKTGAILWKVYTGDNSPQSGHYNWSSPLLYNGYAYIGVASDCDNPLVQGEVIKVDLTQHQIAQIFKTVPDGQVGGGIWTSPSIDPATNSLYLTGGTETGPDQILAQSVYALDATTLALKSHWHLPEADAIGDSDFDTSPILFNDAKGDPLVAAVNKNGYVYTFNRNDIGAGPIWKQLIDIAGMCPLCEESSVSSNTIGADRLYVAAGNTDINGVNYRGSVDALDPATGTFLWRHGTTGSVIGSLVYANGLIIDGAGPDLEVLDASTGKRLYNYRTGNVTYASPSLAHGMIFEGSVDGSLYAFGLPTTATQSASDTTCFKGWTCQDIGLPALSGTEARSGSRWTIKAGGTGSGKFSDQLHFVSQLASGDVQISAKVLTQESAGSSNTPQVGLMLRQNNDPGSPNYAVFLVPHTGVVVQYRTSPGKETIKDIQMSGASMPLYLEIQRRGDQFQAAVSHDGINYTLVPGSSQELAMPTELNAGFALSSTSTTTLTTAVYDELAIGLPNTILAPLSQPSCPQQWTCVDVGNPSTVGDQVVQNGQWTVKGGGTNIWWDSQDLFHFVSQPMTGNGNLSADILSQTGPTPALRSGLMIRQSLSADSPYYAAFVEPDGGPHGIAVVEYRTNQGLINKPIVVTNAAVPIFLKISRVGNMFTAYLSNDGNIWTMIDGSTVPLDIANTAFMGLAVTAKDAHAVNTTVFTDVNKS